MKTLSLVFVLMLSAALFAADVDFSGTWNVVKEKSEIPELAGGPGGGRGGRGDFTPPNMVVSQKKNKMTVERTRTGRNGEERKTETIFDLSGKATKEKTRRGAVEHVAHMKEGVLHVETIRVFERQGMEMEMVTTSTWTLVDDGKGLIVESVMQGQMGERKMKTYYAKQ